MNTPSVPSVPSVSSVEILTPGEDDSAALRSHAEEINAAIEIITGHEAAYAEATLDKRLVIGLELAKAQRLFALSAAQAGALGGRPEKSLSRRDKLSAPSAPSDPSDLSDPSVSSVSSVPEDPAAPPHGFAAWIAAETPRLKRPVAYKYLTAFRALGLDERTATPRHITEELKRLRHQADKRSLPRPTLEGILKAARPKREPLRIEAPAERPTLALEDAREAAHLFIKASRALVANGHLDSLDRPGLEELLDENRWQRDRLTARLKSA